VKNILLLVHDDMGQEARFQSALDICRALDGHLHCLDVTPMPFAMDTPTGSFGAGILFQDAREREASNKTRLQERLAHEDVPWSWADTVADFGQALRLASDMADLIVISSQIFSYPDPAMRAAADELILYAHRPILAVPAGLERFDVAGPALVAWDGSAPASAAMIAAIPLLSKTSSTTLFQIGEGSPENTVEDAAAYLSRHGIHARIVQDPDLGQPIGKTLLTAVGAQRPTYVVMGGYGHRPVTEALLGGATRAMLEKCPTPLFVAR